MSERPTVHANCVVVGEAGVLIRGPSGAGKSSLSEALIDAARARGSFARLVADDRVRLAAHGGRLVARVPEPIAGLIERRGIGIGPAAHIGAAVVRMVADLEDEPERMPEPGERFARLEGVLVARVRIDRRAADAPAFILRSLAALADAECGPFALALEGRTGGMNEARRGGAPQVRSRAR